LNVVGRENTGIKKIPEWEYELWSYLSRGDGTNCPALDSCATRRGGGWCFEDNKEGFSGLYGSDIVDFNSSSDESQLDALDNLFKDNFPREWKACIIFQLVEALANKYIKQAKLNRPPVPTEVIGQLNITPSIEIHSLPLKAYHGAAWRLEDRWVIHINTEDRYTRQRLTLFHEAFHILAHCNSASVFGRRGINRGLFNEMLAHYFGRCVLMPEGWVKREWAEVNDLKRMAEIFQVKQASMWIRLRTMGLI